MSREKDGFAKLNANKQKLINFYFEDIELEKITGYTVINTQQIGGKEVDNIQYTDIEGNGVAVEITFGNEAGRLWTIKKNKFNEVKDSASKDIIIINELIDNIEDTVKTQTSRSAFMQPAVSPSPAAAFPEPSLSTPATPPSLTPDALNAARKKLNKVDKPAPSVAPAGIDLSRPRGGSILDPLPSSPTAAAALPASAAAVAAAVPLPASAAAAAAAASSINLDELNKLIGRDFANIGEEDFSPGFESSQITLEDNGRQCLVFVDSESRPDLDKRGIAVEITEDNQPGRMWHIKFDGDNKKVYESVDDYPGNEKIFYEKINALSKFVNQAIDNSPGQEESLAAAAQAPQSDREGLGTPTQATASAPSVPTPTAAPAAAERKASYPINLETLKRNVAPLIASEAAFKEFVKDKGLKVETKHAPSREGSNTRYEVTDKAKGFGIAIEFDKNSKNPKILVIDPNGAGSKTYEAVLPEHFQWANNFLEKAKAAAVANHASFDEPASAPAQVSPESESKRGPRSAKEQLMAEATSLIGEAAKEGIEKAGDKYTYKAFDSQVIGHKVFHIVHKDTNKGIKGISVIYNAQSETPLTVRTIDEVDSKGRITKTTLVESDKQAKDAMEFLKQFKDDAHLTGNTQQKPAPGPQGQGATAEAKQQSQGSKIKATQMMFSKEVEDLLKELNDIKKPGTVLAPDSASTQKDIETKLRGELKKCLESATKLDPRPLGEDGFAVPTTNLKPRAKAANINFENEIDFGEVDKGVRIREGQPGGIVIFNPDDIKRIVELGETFTIEIPGTPPHQNEFVIFKNGVLTTIENEAGVSKIGQDLSKMVEGFKHEMGRGSESKGPEIGVTQGPSGPVTPATPAQGAGTPTGPGAGGGAGDHGPRRPAPLPPKVLTETKEGITIMEPLPAPPEFEHIIIDPDTLQPGPRGPIRAAPSRPAPQITPIVPEQKPPVVPKEIKSMFETKDKVTEGKQQLGKGDGTVIVLPPETPAPPAAGLTGIAAIKAMLHKESVRDGAQLPGKTAAAAGVAARAGTPIDIESEIAPKAAARPAPKAAATAGPIDGKAAAAPKADLKAAAVAVAAEGLKETFGKISSGTSGQSLTANPGLPSKVQSDNKGWSKK
jgi:hypothetical protein